MSSTENDSGIFKYADTVGSLQIDYLCRVALAISGLIIVYLGLRFLFQNKKGFTSRDGTMANLAGSAMIALGLFAIGQAICFLMK